MNLTYNDEEKQAKKYVSTKLFIIVLLILVIVISIAFTTLTIIFDKKIKDVVEAIEMKDKITVIQDKNNNTEKLNNL